MKIKKIYILIGLIVVVILLSGCVKKVSKIEEEYCIKAQTGEKLSLSEAKEIAKNSECAREAMLKEAYSCDETTGIWWIGLDVQKKLCTAECSVDVTTKRAEINWRCTGALLTPPEELEKRYRYSTYGQCQTDNNCFISGCNSQICQSKTEAPLTSMCQVPPPPTPEQSGYQCKCLTNKCQWVK